MTIFPIHAFPFVGTSAGTEIGLCPCAHSSVRPPLLQALDALDLRLLCATDCSRVTFANQAARRILDEGALTLNDGKISGATPKATRELRALIADVAHGVRGRGFYRLPAPAGKQSLLLTVVAAGDDPSDCADNKPSVLILVGANGLQEAPPVEMMRAFFDLTPAEAKMAAEMIKGDGLKASAKRLGVTPSTARTHLNHVFDKTGTRRQAELAVLLVASSPIGADRRTAAD